MLSDLMKLQLQDLKIAVSRKRAVVNELGRTERRLRQRIDELNLILSGNMMPVAKVDLPM